MACSNCGKQTAIRVERISTGQLVTRQRTVATQKLGSRKLVPRSVQTAPANDLDKNRA